MAGGTIKFDFDATMQTAQKLTSAKDLIKDAYGRAKAFSAMNPHWIGEAADAASKSLQEVERTLKHLDGLDHTIVGFLLRSSEAFTGWDRDEAQAIKASWHDK